MFSSFSNPLNYFFDAINLANATLPLALSAKDISVGIPQSMTSSVTDEVNTSVLLSAVNGSGYVDTASVYYRREDLEAMFQSADISPDISKSTPYLSWVDLLQALNDKYSTAFGDGDVPTEPWASITATETLIYTVPPTSLLYTGQLSITITVPVAI